MEKLDRWSIKELNLKELKEIARENKVKGFSRLKKSELIEKLKKDDLVRAILEMNFLYNITKKDIKEFYERRGYKKGVKGITIAEIRETDRWWRFRSEYVIQRQLKIDRIHARTLEIADERNARKPKCPQILSALSFPGLGWK